MTCVIVIQNKYFYHTYRTLFQNAIKILPIIQQHKIEMPEKNKKKNTIQLSKNKIENTKQNNTIIRDKLYN